MPPGLRWLTWRGGGRVRGAGARSGPARFRVMADVIDSGRRGTGRLRDLLHDPVRLGVQGAAAAAATYGLMTALDWRHLTWGLISALFVLQRNSDATRRSLAGRLGGAAAGSLIGLAAVAIAPGETLAIWRLPAAAFLAMLVAVIRPRQSYVIVAAVAVALENSDPAWVGALERVRAIATGSLMAAAASTLIWREPAATRARRALAEAVAACGRLADLLIPSVAGPGPDEREAMHAAYRRAMRAARARIADCPARRREQLQAVARGLDRVWHDLVFIDRLSDRRTQAVRRRDLPAVRDHVCAALESLRLALLGLAPPGRAGDPAGGAVVADDAPRDIAGFILKELERDLAGLRGCVLPPPDRAGRSRTAAEAP